MLFEDKSGVREMIHGLGSLPPALNCVDQMAFVAHIVIMGAVLLMSV